jgi:hypothetical protein
MNLSNWRPAPIQLSEAWGHPLALLSLAFGETSDARQHSQELSRAMKMVDLSEVMRHYP